MTQQGNKNVLITGAYGGLGKALAQKYLDENYNLFLSGRCLEKLELLMSELQKNNTHKCSILLYQCDLEDNSSIYRMIDRVKKRCKSIDVLINCAGTFPINKLENVEIDEYLKCMQINLTAPFILIKEFSKNMVENKWGRIINIASSSAYAGSPRTCVYSASKHALLGLSRSLYKELKTEGVRVFCVSPGSIQTDMGREVEKLGQLYDTFMTPEEVAGYIFHTTSYDGSMISEEIRLNRVFVQ
tara:strand:+ start:10078 stop:10806 length:729 start_codon:yes stop_codon:yes gene_type:complete